MGPISSYSIINSRLVNTGVFIWHTGCDFLAGCRGQLSWQACSFSSVGFGTLPEALINKTQQVN